MTSGAFIFALLCVSAFLTNYTIEGRCDPFLKVPGRILTKPIVKELRAAMADPRVLHDVPLDALIITNDDEHQSPFVAERDKRRTFISGFTGSEGTAVVTSSEAVLWTDSRYYLQAEHQLDCWWAIMRSDEKNVPSITEWLGSKLKALSRVGADPRVISHTTWTEWKSQLEKKNITLVEVDHNPVDHIWTKRPPYGLTPAMIHDMKYAGKNFETKLSELRDEMSILGVSAMVVTALDEIAWLLNIRANDIPHIPVLKSYVIISNYELHLFAHRTYLNKSVLEHLKTSSCSNENCTRLHSYEDFFLQFNTFSYRWDKILFPSGGFLSRGASQAVYSSIKPDKWVLNPSPIIFLKAKKNPTERRGMHEAHVRDAIALCDFLAHMEYEMSMNKPWTEVKVAEMIEIYRQEQRLYSGSSFPTVVGFGPHGALPHYVPSNLTDVPILKNSTVVLDSGGQYLDGTTDVTRTLHFGEPSKEEREMYTRVLQGQIDLARLVFPTRVTMSAVDILARAPLWKVGLDYGHGTGHGIGSYLLAHEAPIAVMYVGSNLTFQEGYFFSNEPGYYKVRQYGIRLENIFEVVEQKTEHNYDGPYLGFKPITLVPYEPKLIMRDMLSNDQIEWLNDYNVKILINIGPELKRQKKYDSYKWLLKKTMYIPRPQDLCIANFKRFSFRVIIFLTLLLILNHVL